MIRYISYAEYEARAEAELRRMGLPVTRVDYGNIDGKHYHLKPKPTKRSLPFNGRRGRRASMPRHGGSNKRTGN